MKKMIFKKLLITISLMGTFFVLKVNATNNVNKEFTNINKDYTFTNENKKIQGLELTPSEFVEYVLINKNIFEGEGPKNSLIKNDKWKYRGLKAILTYALDEIIKEYIKSKYDDYESYIKTRNEIYSKLHFLSLDAEKMVIKPIIKYTEEYEDANEEKKEELERKAEEERQKKIKIMKAKQKEINKQELEEYLKNNNNEVYNAINRRMIEIRENLIIDRNGAEEKLKLDIDNMNIFKRIINIYAGCGEKTVDEVLQQTKDTYDIFLIVNAFIKIINENSKYFLFSDVKTGRFDFHERFKEIFARKKLPKKNLKN